MEAVKDYPNAINYSKTIENINDALETTDNGNFKNHILFRFYKRNGVVLGDDELNSRFGRANKLLRKLVQITGFVKIEESNDIWDRELFTKVLKTIFPDQELNYDSMYLFLELRIYESKIYWTTFENIHLHTLHKHSKIVCTNDLQIDDITTVKKHYEHVKFNEKKNDAMQAK